MTADTITAIKKALEDLEALVTIVAKDTGANMSSGYVRRFYRFPKPQTLNCAVIGATTSVSRKQT